MTTWQLIGLVFKTIKLALNADQQILTGGTANRQQRITLPAPEITGEYQINVQLWN